jgi:hypothetical protein
MAALRLIDGHLHSRPQATLPQHAWSQMLQHFQKTFTTFLCTLESRLNDRKSLHLEADSIRLLIEIFMLRISDTPIDVAVDATGVFIGTADSIIIYGILIMLVGCLKLAAKAIPRQDKIAADAPGETEGAAYHGIKRGLVRLLAHLCHESRVVQDEIRRHEGVPLILDHCNIDDHNPCMANC